MQLWGLCVLSSSFLLFFFYLLACLFKCEIRFHVTQTSLEPTTQLRLALNSLSLGFDL